ncbi:MAG: hypothetical protein ABIP06_09010 [Pyrinomonadaceae bacterium]
MFVGSVVANATVIQSDFFRALKDPAKLTASLRDVLCLVFN